MRRRQELLLLAAAFLGVAGAHIWMIWMAPTALSFSVRHVHTDNAVILMMGKHILEKGEFPIFYYGQDCFGSLSTLAHAAAFLVLGGIPAWSIHVAMSTPDRFRHAHARASPACREPVDLWNQLQTPIAPPSTRSPWEQ